MSARETALLSSPSTPMERYKRGQEKQTPQQTPGRNNIINEKKKAKTSENDTDDNTEPSLSDPPEINRMSLEKSYNKDEDEYFLSDKVGALLEFMVVDGWKMEDLNKILQVLPLSDEERKDLKSYAAVCFALVD